MVDCFAEVRNRVPAIEVAKFYGMEFDKSGRKARCIFHSPDNHPSMSFYNGGFHCWACEEHGSSIDLVQQLYSVSAIDAVRLINSDFHLGLKIDGKLSKEDYLALRKREKLVDEHRKFEAWREFFINRLNTAYRKGHLALLQPGRNTDADAIRFMSTAEYYCNQLTYGDADEQASVYREREKIGRWIDKIMKD